MALAEPLAVRVAQRVEVLFGGSHLPVVGVLEARQFGLGFSNGTSVGALGVGHPMLQREGGAAALGGVGDEAAGGTTMSAAIHRTAADQIRTAIAYSAAPRNPSTPDLAQRVAREMAFE